MHSLQEQIKRIMIKGLLGPTTQQSEILFPKYFSFIKNNNIFVHTNVLF